jgi:hypothetical protein
MGTQIPPLRYASALMNKMLGQDLRAHLRGLCLRWGAPQIPPLRSPEFLSRLAALANFMRSSLTKTAHVDLSDVAKQEFGYAPVGMTNLFGGEVGDDKFVWGRG